MTHPAGAARRTLASFTVPSVAGNERLALMRVADAVAGEGIAGRQLERLKTAVSEATLNAMEHGNGFDPGIGVDIEVMRAGSDIVVTVTDQGGGEGGDPSGSASGAAGAGTPLPAEEPDLGRKLAGVQDVRGWGLFLIRHMVDAMEVRTDGPRRTVWLTLRGGRPVTERRPGPVHGDGEGRS